MGPFVSVGWLKTNSNFQEGFRNHGLTADFMARETVNDDFAWFCRLVTVKCKPQKWSKHLKGAWYQPANASPSNQAACAATLCLATLINIVSHQTCTATEKLMHFNTPSETKEISDFDYAMSSTFQRINLQDKIAQYHGKAIHANHMPIALVWLMFKWMGHDDMMGLSMLHLMGSSSSSKSFCGWFKASVDAKRWILKDFDLSLPACIVCTTVASKKIQKTSLGSTSAIWTLLPVATNPK